MPLLEPPKKLNQSQVLWELLSEFLAPIFAKMKEARTAAAKKLSAYKGEGR
jgi:hypothetical protein